MKKNKCLLFNIVFLSLLFSCNKNNNQDSNKTTSSINSSQTSTSFVIPSISSNSSITSSEIKYKVEVTNLTSSIACDVIGTGQYNGGTDVILQCVHLSDYYVTWILDGEEVSNGDVYKINKISKDYTLQIKLTENFNADKHQNYTYNNIVYEYSSKDNGYYIVGLDSTSKDDKNIPIVTSIKLIDHLFLNTKVLGFKKGISNKYLQTITFSDNVNYFLVDYAFKDCTSLTSITLNKGLTKVPKYAFYNCKSLKNINLPTTVTEIDDYAFYNSGFVSFSFTTNMTRIGNYAFSLSKLESASISTSITEIGSFAFSDCSNLKTVVIPSSVTNLGNNKIISSTTTYGGVFKNCPLLNKAVIRANITTLNQNMFYNCPSLNQVELPSSLTKIEEYAFAMNTNLVSINIPSNVTSIGKSCFNSCSKLTNVNIPNGVTSIESNLFSNCSALENISLPSSITSISQEAFLNCSSLKAIIIPNDVTIIENRTFKGCTSLTVVTLSSKTTRLSEEAFSNCTSLKTINLNNVQVFESSVFDSAGIEEVTLENVSNLTSSLFINTNKLKKVTIKTSNDVSFNSNVFFNSTIEELIIDAFVSSFSSTFLNDSKLTTVYLNKYTKETASNINGINFLISKAKAVVYKTV